VTDTTHPDVNPEGIDVETCLQQLRDPAVILAEALYRVHQADAAQATIDALPMWLSAEAQTNADRLLGRQAHLADTADTLAYIAKAAADMAHQERQGQVVFTAEQLESEDLQSGPAHEYSPQPVVGVRFTATLTGYRYLGPVGGREWVYQPGYGFLDVSDSEQVSVDVHGLMYTMSGRVVSATPDHVLCITDGGTSVTLPRALIVESADE
jgi:hypothetical protein